MNDIRFLSSKKEKDLFRPTKNIKLTKAHSMGYFQSCFTVEGSTGYLTILLSGVKSSMRPDRRFTKYIAAPYVEAVLMCCVLEVKKQQLLNRNDVRTIFKSCRGASNELS